MNTIIQVLVLSICLLSVSSNKCPEDCSFVSLTSKDKANGDTWTCQCSKSACEELECANNSTCKIRYSQTCKDNICNRSKTVHCLSHKKQGLCPMPELHLNSTAKACHEDVDCEDSDKCCSNANKGYTCVSPCFKPMCKCQENHVQKYITNSKGCPSCICVKTTEAATKICSLPKLVGTCRAAHSRYYFDSSLIKCKKFIYGGCHGNENNFHTLEMCESTCLATNSSLNFNSINYKKRNHTSKCFQSKKVGPCKAAIENYYYNTETKKCEQFFYGGCKGNKNRFTDESECIRECAQSLKENVTKTNKCELEKEVGPCKAAFTKYFYNKQSKTCEEFTYGGCRGNENNFDKLEDCIKECKTSSIIEPLQIKQDVKINKCELNPEGGKCRGFVERFYYNSKSESCDIFIWGGCGGNENNFALKEECVKECHPNIAIKVKAYKPNEICQMKKEIGPCRALFHRYYFNSTTNTCEKFGYGGCKGNANNFHSAEDCARECLSSDQPTVESLNVKIENSTICSLQKETGMCRAYIPRYYFNKDTQKCENFVYGGCSGNQNNFETEEKCNNTCKPQSNT